MGVRSFERLAQSASLPESICRLFMEPLAIEVVLS